MFLGFDTSNYTTSAAAFDGKEIIQFKKLLEVKKNERGLRQSDAVFQHTVNMPKILDPLSSAVSEKNIDAVGVSVKPRGIEGSYMPCFLVGENTATAVSSFSHAPLFKTSHQTGHVLAALYSADCLEYIEKSFIAFHVSGGTTEALLVEPDKEDIIKCKIIAQSTDLKAGQFIDRTGVLLGLKFPCGVELEKLSEKSVNEFKIKTSMKGADCSLSGIENKVKKMVEENKAAEDIAKFAIMSVNGALEAMAKQLKSDYPKLPMIFSGGVCSNKYINRNLSEKFSAVFAEPQFSSDNAAGIAVYAYLKSL